MSKLKIERGASKVRRSPLKVTIDGTVADDLELMCEWSENDSSYLVNLLLGFAIAQSEDFQKYKAGPPSATVRPDGTTKPGPSPVPRPQNGPALPPEKGPNA